MSEAPPTLEEASIDTRLDRLPPHSLEAEKGILGCIMLSYRESLDACARIPSLDAFYNLSHRTIYEAMVAMDQNRVAIDVITLQEYLKTRDQLEAVGGLSQLASLADSVPSAANVSYYLGIVLEAYAKRRVIQVATSAIQSAYESNDPGLLVEEFEREALSIRSGDSSGDKSNKEVLIALTEDLQQEWNGIFKGLVATGLHDFDKRYRGFSPGNLALMAARPSVGKTNMLLQMALNMASSIPVGFCSLEMTHEEVARRQVANLSGLDLRHKPPTLQEEKRLVISINKVSALPIHISDLSARTIRQLSHKARQWSSEFGIKVLFVDYIQLCKGSSKRSRDDRRLEIAEISAGLKALAKDLHIVVIAAAQLGRQVEARAANSRPRLSDLREAGELEQDADWVMFLWKGKQKNEDEAEGDSVCVTMTVAKNRNGPTGDIELIHHKPTGRFLPKAQIEDNDYQNHP